MPFELYVDASLDGLGMTLGQMQNGKEVVIAYSRRSLNSAELSYLATEKEVLAVVEGIKKFQPYLYGRKFTVHTDHHTLKCHKGCYRAFSVGHDLPNSLISISNTDQASRMGMQMFYLAVHIISQVENIIEMQKRL